jgi:hypothetical protein
MNGAKNFPVYSKPIRSKSVNCCNMSRQPIIGSVVGLLAGGTLSILSLTIAQGGKVGVFLGFAGGITIVGSFFILIATVRG